MTKLKSIGLCFALLCAGQTAFAQGVKIKPVQKFHNANHETLDSSVARLAVKAALQPSAQPTRQELLSVILLMSLRDQRTSGT
jgi:hypothetical protein